MGHLHPSRLSKTGKWREVVALLDAGASAERIAAAAVKAAETATKHAAQDPAFLAAVKIMVELPLAARGPGYGSFLEDLGVSAATVPDLLASLTRALDRTPATSDLGEMARMALVAAIGEEVTARVPSLFEPNAADVRSALGKLAGGDGFAGLARRFYAELSSKTLSYYLSRELARHTGEGMRFADDAARVAFDAALARHSWEAAAILTEFAPGWYGKNVWRGDGPTPEKITGFATYAFKKLRSELARRRDAA